MSQENLLVILAYVASYESLKTDGRRQYIYYSLRKEN
jgi:hypothetical protein